MCQELASDLLLYIRWLISIKRIDAKCAAQELLSQSEATLILEKGRDIHEDLLTSHWDDTAVGWGTDEQHQAWATTYADISNLIQGLPHQITNAEAINLMEKDAEGHTFYINHPKYLVAGQGNLDHHRRWRNRWLGIAQYLRHIEGEL